MQISEQHLHHYPIEYEADEEMQNNTSNELEARIQRLPSGFERVIEYLKEPKLVDCLFALIELGEAEIESDEPTEMLKELLEKEGSDLAAYSEENERLREETSRLTNESIELKREIRQLTEAKDEEHERLIRLKQELETENDILVRRNEELVVQLQHFKDDLTELEDAHKNRIDEKSHEIERLNAEITRQSEELAGKRPSNHRSAETDVDLDFEVAIKYGHLNTLDGGSDGPKLDLSSFDPAHLIQLLLHDNYLLSNIAKQKFIDEQPVYESLLNKLSSKPNPKFCKEILTTLINYKDLAFNGVYVKNYLDWIISNNSNGEQNPIFKGNNLGQFKSNYVIEENNGKEKIIDSLREELEFKESVEQEVGVQGQIISKHAIESLFYKTLCTYYQKLINGGVEELVSYDTQELIEASQEIRFLRKQLLNINESESDQKVSRSMDESILAFRKVESEDNKASLNEIIYGLNVTINAEAGQLREQELKIEELQEMNKLFETEGEELKGSLQKKLDILLASTDLEKIKKLTDLIEKETNIIQAQERDLSILQIQPDTASFGVEVTTEDEEIPKLIEAVEIHQRQLLITKQNVETFSSEMFKQVNSVSKHFSEKVKQSKKGIKNLNLKTVITHEVLEKEEALIESLDTALDAEIKKPIAVKDTETEEVETRECQIDVRPETDQSTQETDDTFFAPEEEKTYKDVETDPVECPDCKKLISEYIISKSNLEHFQEMYQTAIQENEAEEKKINDLNDYKRNYHNLEKRHEKLSADLNASHEVNKSLKKSEEEYETMIEELQASNKQLTDTISTQESEMKLKQERIKELNEDTEKNNELMLSENKQLEDSETKLKKTEEYVLQMEKEEELLIQEDKLTTDMRKVIDNENEIILDLKKKNKTYIKPKDKEFLSSILTEEDIRNIYE